MANSSLTALFIASLACLFSLQTRLQTTGGSNLEAGPSSLQRTLDTHVFRAGYSGFPPYTIVDPNETDSAKRVSGFSADLIREICDRQSPPWKIEWQKISWESLKGDMSSGRFDVLIDPVYQTLPRAAEFLMSEPYSYFGVAAGLVRKGDTRFQRIQELNKSGARISLAEGWTSTDYARAHLPLAALRIVPIGDDPFLQFHEVLSGRADIALQDVPTVLQFVRAHPNEVEARWVGNPPMRVAGGFLLRRGDFEMKAFLDTSLRALEAEGRIAELDQKWRSLGEFAEKKTQLGAGFAAEADIAR